MDEFFTKTRCDRCGGSLEGGSTMSMFSTECICMVCKDAETKRDDYREAVEGDHREIRRGNLNFKGIGYRR